MIDPKTIMYEEGRRNALDLASRASAMDGTAIMQVVATLFLAGVGGYAVRSCFNPSEHLPDYASHLAHECPQCKAGVKLDALVNGFGYSKL